MRKLVGAWVIVGGALCACGNNSAVDANNTDGANLADAPACDVAGRLGSGWHGLAELPSARQEIGVAALGGEVYIVGGFEGLSAVATVQAYNPCTDAWRDVAYLPRPLHHVSVAAHNGKLYALGGMDGLSFTPVPDVFAYDPAQNRWDPKTSMNVPRGACAVAVVADQIVLAGGSVSASTSVADVSAYDPVNDRWEPLPPLPAAADHVVGAGVGELAFAIGGRAGAITSVSSRVDAFDPAVGAWSMRTSLPTPRGGSSAAVVGGQIYVMGGEGNVDDPSGVFSETEVYDPVANVWSTAAPMLTPRHGTGAAAIAGVIFVPGGADVQSFGAVATHEAFVP